MIYIYYQGDRVPKVPRNVTSVIIHHSVTSIEAFAFEGCKSLVFIYIPSSVKKIGVCAFRGCTKIMAIHLPPTMKIIGLRAFKDCKQLVTLELPPPKVMPRLGDSLFQGCVSLDRTSKMTDREFSSWLRRRFDNLPLHRICYRTNVTVKAIKNCIKDKPFAARDRDKLKMTPLHILVSNRSATPTMVKELLDIYPDAIFCKNSNGSLPIHLACTNPNATLHGFIKELAERPLDSGEYPSSRMDQNQNIPTVQAIENHLEFRVQRFLYSCEPAQISSLKGRGFRNQTKKLERQYMMDMIDSPPSSLHFFQPVQQHGWVSFVKNLSDRKTIQMCVDFIDDSEKCPNEVAEALGYAKNHNHRQAINLAIPEIRHALQRRVLFLSRYDLTKGPPVYKTDTTLVTKAIDKNADVQYKERILDFIAKSKKTKVIDKRTFQEVLSRTDSRLFSKSFFKDNFNTKKAGNHTKMSVKEILEFVALCKRQSAIPHQEEVIIKLMSEEEKYQKEIIIREFHKLDPAFVISVIRKYNVFAARTSPEPTVNENFRFGKYKYALVMPLADRDLDAICFSENLDTETVRSYARDVALAIQHLHSNGIMHGNLNMKHIVRFGGKLRLCDLSACGRISDDDSDPTSYVGTHISSAIVPPEMVYNISDKEEYDQFLIHIKGISSFERFKPVKCKKKGDFFTLKSLLKNNSVRKENETSFLREKRHDLNYVKRTLPYQPMKANVNIDLWAFGVILYTLVTRKSLFPMDRNFSLLDGDVMSDLYSWDDAKKHEALDRIQNADIKDLLSKLFSPNPTSRPKNIEEVLNHIFLNPNLDRHSLTATLYEDVLSRADAESLKSDQEFPKSTSFVCGKVFSSKKIATPTAFILLPYSSVELRKYPKSVEKYMIFVLSLVTTMKDPSDFGKLFIRQKVTDPVYYLYLIDEFTCEPAIPSGSYPIAINSDSLYFKCCLPLMFVALRTMAFENEAASVAKLFFPSLIRPQDETVDKISELLGHKVITCVEDSIEERSVKTAYGPDELRHFSQYLLERDPHLTFSGLKKVSDRNSRVVWVSESSLNIIKNEDDNSGGLKRIDRAGSNSPRVTNIFF